MPKGIHVNKARASRCRRWNTGKLLTKGGHVKVRVGRGHPLADPNGYAYEHLVVWVAAGNSRPGSGMLIHHKNGEKTDNRIENLQVMTRSEHNRIHNMEKGRDSKGRILAISEVQP